MGNFLTTLHFEQKEKQREREREYGSRQCEFFIGASLISRVKLLTEEIINDLSVFMHRELRIFQIKFYAMSFTLP